MLHFPTQLENQQSVNWQKFIDRHPESTQTLTAEQVNDLQQALTLSDYVLESAIHAPELIIELFSSARVYDDRLPNYRALLAEKLSHCQDELSLHRMLRRFRRQEMVNIAIADMVRGIELDLSLARLSELADALILGALEWLTQFCEQKWGVPTSRDGVAQKLLVFGMGKLGGKELNFSSDIDLIFSYPESGETQGCRRSLDNQQFFIRLAQKLIAALDQNTADGFVYRVDMRLRPFGESGPLVMNFNAFEDYYQEQGRDWERYAMLKARLIGEGPFHQRLAELMRPFVYRRYIDFSVIDSLRRMKMMIAQEVRRKNLVNNIKLGAGGIREVEFIVQVFQMIRGGRIKALQERNLLTVLPRLVDEEIISDTSAKVLESAYRFLRRSENLIQALADQQTQTLPDDALNQTRLITMLGFDTWGDYTQVLAKHMQAVHDEFGLLIGEESPNHQAEDQHWQTLWLSDWQDGECIQWLAQEFASADNEKMWQVLKDFRLEVGKRSLGNRGRVVLDKLIPLLLGHLQQEQADEVALERVLSVLNKVVTRTAYLELLYENAGALKHLVKLCRASHWITEYIAKFPILLDELIDPKLLHNPPALTSYKEELRQIMLRVPEDDMEVQMDTLRQFKQAQQLRIAAGDVSGVLPITKVSDHLTALAEAIVDEVVNIAWQQMTHRYGVPNAVFEHLENDNSEAHAARTAPYKGFAVIGYGKMGGIELGYSSDLDLVFVHNSPANDVTNGDKSVAASQFYGKLAQRIMHIFNTRMASGMLYELDLRLRPSGNSGLLVVHIDTYAHYLANEAWTWEHQALVRARAIFGDEDMRQRFADIRLAQLSQAREATELLNDVSKMRDKMRDHLDKSTNDEKDIKQAAGGLVDIEFLAQFLVLKHAHDKAEVVCFSDNIRIFERLEKQSIISAKQRDILIDAYLQLRYQGHQQTLQDGGRTISTDEFNNLSGESAEVVNALMH